MKTVLIIFLGSLLIAPLFIMGWVLTVPSPWFEELILYLFGG